MYSTILVPLDGSKRAERILSHVEEMARRYNAKVVFLKVEEEALQLGYDEVIDISRYHQERERMKKEAESYLSDLEGEFREKGIETRKLISYGPVVKAILNAAEQEDADLIAIASHGYGGLSRIFYGSVAAGVLNCVDRPMLIIRSL